MRAHVLLNLLNKLEIKCQNVKMSFCNENATKTSLNVFMACSDFATSL